MTKDDIFELFNSMTNKDILNVYNKQQLIRLYINIYGKYPRSNISRQGIIDVIRSSIHSLEKEKACNKN